MKGTIMANNTLAMGVVSAVSGEAFARGVDGQMRRLALGDTLYQGDVIITANGSSVQVAPFNAPDFNVGEQQTVAVDTQTAPPDALATSEAPLAAVTVDPAAGPNFDALLEEEAAAAGLGGGDGGGGHSFVDLARINEVVSSVGYDFPTNPTGQPPRLEGLAGLVAEVVATTPTETTPTETTPTETTPTETETTPTETTPTETTPTETTPTETTPTETTPTETETTPTDAD
jgi:cell division septation protein DedD